MYLACEHQGNVYPRIERIGSTTVYSDKVLASFHTESELTQFLDELQEQGYTDSKDCVVGYEGDA
jgi:hypothetical protein